MPFGTGAGPQMYPGQSNTYVPNHAATNYLVTQYSRNPKDFALNQYIQIQDIDEETGLFLQLNAEQAARIVSGDAQFQDLWADGAPRPRRNNANEKFNWVGYRAKRRNQDFTLGWLSRDQAGFSLQDIEFANQAQNAMTKRTRRVHQKLETTSEWANGHIADVAAMAGNTGRWSESTTNRMDIKRSLNIVMDTIRKHTLGVVKKDDLHLVMNNTTAQRIGEAQEMVNAFIQSRSAYPHFTGDESKFTDEGIPTRLYGFPVVIEDAVMVTSRRDAATVTYANVCEDGVAYALARPGQLTAPNAGNGPAQSFSTISLFVYEDMAVESEDDKVDRRTMGDIVDHTDEVFTSPISGFRLENIAA